MNNSIEVLKAAREKLEDESVWTKGAFARTAGGNSIGFDCENAVCFCSLGALRLAAEEVGVSLFKDEYHKAAVKLSEAMSSLSVPAVNDSRGTEHIHILMSFDFAILMAEDEAKQNKGTS